MTDALISPRQKLILRAIVEDYISSARAVSSKMVLDLTGLNVSPATIRNEMSVLSKLGFLEQPHTSSGRVPSALAYRIYVNDLIAEQKVSVQETREINAALRERLAQLDAMIADLSRMISELTNHPAYALLKSRTQLSGAAQLLDHPSYDEIEKARQLLAYIDDGGSPLPLPPPKEDLD